MMPILMILNHKPSDDAYVHFEVSNLSWCPQTCKVDEWTIGYGNAMFFGGLNRLDLCSQSSRKLPGQIRDHAINCILCNNIHFEARYYALTWHEIVHLWKVFQKAENVFA